MSNIKQCSTCRNFCGMTREEGICLVCVQEVMVEGNTQASKLNHHVMERDDMCDEWDARSHGVSAKAVRHAIRDMRVNDVPEELLELIYPHI